MRLLVVGAISAVHDTALRARCGKSQTAPAATAPKALSSGIDPANFDNSVRAQDDFYRHVDGTWLKKTDIPADKPNYGAFPKLADDAEQHLLAIIDASNTKKDKTDETDKQQVSKT